VPPGTNAFGALTANSVNLTLGTREPGRPRGGSAPILLTGRISGRDAHRRHFQVTRHPCHPCPDGAAGESRWQPAQSPSPIRTTPTTSRRTPVVIAL
jgi:hypothetical protein